MSFVYVRNFLISIVNSHVSATSVSSFWNHLSGVYYMIKELNETFIFKKLFKGSRFLGFWCLRSRFLGSRFLGSWFLGFWFLGSRFLVSWSWVQSPGFRLCPKLFFKQLISSKKPDKWWGTWGNHLKKT